MPRATPNAPRPPRRAASAPPIVWAIAGTDPSGGAGIAADLKTLQALGVYGAPVVTAVTAQNTRALREIERCSERIVRAQLRALAEDLPPAAVKIGMLGGAAIVRVVAEALAELTAPAVCDPVLAATVGGALLDAPGRAALVELLLPRLAALTPNAPEAAALTGLPVETPEEVRRAADRLLAMGPRAVVLKGGHLGGRESRDYFTDGRESFWMASPRLASRNTHGTGCVFSSALAAGLALGRTPAEAALWAKAYVHQGIRRGPALGGGRGPLAHPGPPRAARDFPRRETA